MLLVLDENNDQHGGASAAQVNGLQASSHRRFRQVKAATKACDFFHPESWNLMWSVSSILTGLLSFKIQIKKMTSSGKDVDVEDIEDFCATMSSDQDDNFGDSRRCYFVAI